MLQQPPAYLIDPQLVAAIMMEAPTDWRNALSLQRRSWDPPANAAMPAAR